jgi:hypothetical protein
LANQQFDSMKSQMKWDQQALEAWLEESAQKDEDALTLKKYSKEDDSKIKVNPQPHLNMDVWVYFTIHNLFIKHFQGFNVEN